MLLAVALTAAPAAPSGAGPGPVVTSASTTVDAELVERGLRARVGEALDGWRVEIGEETGGAVTVTLTQPDGGRDERDMQLAGETAEDRSRELAAALAIVVDQYVPPPETGPPEPPPPRNRMFYVSAGPRIAVGSPAHPDLGGNLAAGLWVLDEHLQPRIQGSYIASPTGRLLLHGVRFGAGLAAGGSVARHRLWLGALAMPQAQWAQARDRLVLDAWGFSLELSAVAQVRWDRVFLGARTGADLVLPPLTAKGAGVRVRWGTFRYMAALEVGVRF